ncbi:MAG: DNA-binding protein [Candidatus Omnitrophota bacterium]
MLKEVHSPQSIVYSLLFCLLTVVCGLSTLCFAQSISSTELINNAKQHDGQTVRYAGEVIGEIMARQGHAWINVNDGKNALGIWVDKTLLKDIKYSGGYQTQGDWVEVQGVFHRACREHGGDLDIHADSVMLVRPGAALAHPLEKAKVKAGIVLLGIIILFAIVYAVLRRIK